MRKTIRDVLKEHVKELLLINGVVGVGIGVEGEEEVIKVLVRKKNDALLRRIPGKLGGYRTVVVESGSLEVRGSR